MAPILLHAAGLCAGDDALDLGGQWQIAPVTATNWEAAGRPAEDTEWETVELPNRVWSPRDRDKGLDGSYQSCPGVWARRVFTLTDEQAAMDAVLQWEFIKYGFDAWLNGAPLGSVALYCPGTMAVPPDRLRAGENVLLLKVRNWSEVPRGERGYPLHPVGGGLFSWGHKMSGIFEPLALDFHRGARIASALARPHLLEQKVEFAVTLDAHASTGAACAVHARVTDGAGTVVGRATQRVDIEAQGRPVVLLDVALPGYQPWTPQAPELYSAEFTLDGPGVEDRHHVRFGMRSFAARNGVFYFNGHAKPLRGSNLMHEWLRENYYHDESLTDLLIDKARAMNCNVFRTHTLPPSRWAADLCDRHGMMLIAEMPLTYNYGDMQFSREEEEQYRMAAEEMCRAWVAALANHPSIIMWVSSNEPVQGDRHDQHVWDCTHLIPAMKDVDPTRPILRSGEESPDVQDTHCYAGYWGGAARDFEEFARHRAVTDDGHRPIMNSEYIEGAPPARRFLWSGSEKRDHAWELTYALVGMEQTEVLRRLGYDGILPYMFSFWTRGTWRDDAPSPMFAALRYGLAPAAVSLEVWDRNFMVGEHPEVQVWLMNDEGRPVRGRLTCYVCRQDPEFATDGPAYEDAMPVFMQDLEIGANERAPLRMAFPLPDEEGRCWLAAVLQTENGPAVMSERPINVLAHRAVPAELQGCTVRLLGADDATRAWFAAQGITAFDGLPFGHIDQDVDMVILWEHADLGVHAAAEQQWLNDYLSEGGAVLMMARKHWNSEGDWMTFPSSRDGERIEYSSTPHRCSSVFPGPSAAPYLWQDLEQVHLVRWNGMNNAVCVDALDAAFIPDNDNDGQAAEPHTGAEVLAISGAREPVLARRTVDHGRLYLTQLLFGERLREGSFNYDPAAERMFLNLLTEVRMQRKRAGMVAQHSD